MVYNNNRKKEHHLCSKNITTHIYYIYHQERGCPLPRQTTRGYMNARTRVALGTIDSRSMVMLRMANHPTLSTLSCPHK